MESAHSDSAAATATTAGGTATTAGAATAAGTASPAAEKKPRSARADAQRNRDRLLLAARAAFAAGGDSVPLEGIAREAGVGIGTLYRHFPTREALVEAVYAAELDDVTGCVPDLLAELSPDAALRAWMGRYAAFFATKRGIAETLRSGRVATPATRQRITCAIATILASGVAAGVLRTDVEAADVTTMLLGIFLSTTAVKTPERTERLLDLLMDALRAKTAR